MYEIAMYDVMNGEKVQIVDKETGYVIQLVDAAEEAYDIIDEYCEENGIYEDMVIVGDYM